MGKNKSNGNFSNRRLSSIKSIKELRQVDMQLERALLRSEERMVSRFTFRSIGNRFASTFCGASRTGTLSMLFKGVSLALALFGGKKKRKGFLGLF